MAYQVFISFKRNALDGSGKTRDYELAADLHKALKARGIETFFSEKDLSTSKFRDEIDTALEEARILVVVGTSRAHLESENVKYEWRAFHEDMLNGIKPNGQLYTYLEGMPQTHLPLALRHYQSFLSNQKELLVHFIMENLGIQDVPSHPQPTQDTTAKPAPQPAPQPQPPVLPMEPKPVPVTQPVHQPQPVSYPSPVSYSTRPIQNISQPVSQPAARKSVQSTPLIVTVAVVLVIAMVSGIWAISHSNSNPASDLTSSSTSDSTDDSTESVKSLSELGSVSVGDHFTFGNYPQGEDGEEQPIEWRVLAVESGKALVISEKLLDYVPYNREYTDVTWETCTLRTWMNNGFLNNAFNSDEQAKLVTITNQNPNNPTYGTEGGNATQDRIFALSIDEAKKYFSSDSDRKAYTTDYTHKKEYDHDDRSEWWWLRSPGSYGRYAANVHSGGSVSQHGSNVKVSDVAVRPAFWLNL